MREEQLIDLLRKFGADLSVVDSIEGIERVEYMGKTFYLYRKKQSV
jgi:hypothetical protein